MSSYFKGQTESRDMLETVFYFHMQYAMNMYYSLLCEYTFIQNTWPCICLYIKQESIYERAA